MTADNPPPDPLRSMAAIRAHFGQTFGELAERMREPTTARRVAATGALILVLAGLFLPPVSLVTRVTTIGYAVVRPNADVSVPSDPPGAWLEIRRRAMRKTTRARLRTLVELPGWTSALPTGYVLQGEVYHLDFQGPLPDEAWLNVPLDVTPDMLHFVDPYGWDGSSWQWLSPSFDTNARARILLPLDRFSPRLVVLTLATAASTEVSAVLQEPPAVVPAAVAELPIIELRGYHLFTDDGSVSGRSFPVPSEVARVYGVVDNLEAHRYRTDLVNNVLILPESRQRHREAIVSLARRDELHGVVLDYYGIAPDLQAVYTDMVRRLAEDLHAEGVELLVSVPMPHRTSSGWDGSPYSWRALGGAVDAVRVRLPDDAPLETEVLDGMVRWALEQVSRRKLQLAVPVQVRDVVGTEVRRIDFGDALGQILDLAKSDAPTRISPGSMVQVELPTVGAAELGRDPATGMWRFYYWDDNRRQHTVWMNDAAGLTPAFDIAIRYRLSRVALDGVSVGLDPSIWRMVRTFTAGGEVPAVPSSYRLTWRLLDENGKLVQEAVQPLDDPVFRFLAPSNEGAYQLSVSLVNDENRLVAYGDTWRVEVGAPLPPPPTPTTNAIAIVPTPETYVTAPAPADEARLQRTPVRVLVEGTPEAEEEGDYDGTVAYPSAELRDRPSLGGDQLSDLRIGQRVRVLGRDAGGRWLKVRVLSTGVEGWVYAQVLDLLIDAGRLPVITPPTATPRSTTSRD